ncbi:MAG TPA: LapA family protein [Aestuariivirga sp.]|nr:LapA family protein [Aestuariivirga sp.]
MTIRRLFNWIVGLPVAIIVVAFAIANRERVVLSLDPFSSEPYASITTPLWGVLFGGIFIGLLAGWVAAWFAHGKWRRATREARVELLRSQQEHEQLKREMASRAVVSQADQPL